MQADLLRKETGEAGELQAARYLEGEGYTIIDRNFKTPVGEIDIIAKKGGILHFFEVKTRHGMNFGGPFDALTPLKKRRIRKTAKWFLAQKKGICLPCLFGVVGIDLSQNPPTIECLVDAFE
jgi:putative endonuclease